MKRVTLKKPAVFIALSIACLLFALFVRSSSASNEQGARYFSEKVNLALRRTAHLLLAEGGDTTSRIPPVQQPEPYTFVIRFERGFDYSKLPVLLKESFDLHGIQRDYDVAVFNADDGSLQLGYNFQDYAGAGEVPCGGRAQGSGAYDVTVLFDLEEKPSFEIAGWWGLVAGGIFAGLFFWRYRRPASPAEPGPPAPQTPLVQLGASSAFDLVNQTLQTGATFHKLTYREAKLLHLFGKHPNQLLERDFILKSVWEDEGILVGRSVDVFVSRLRKLLREDDSVRIAAVHGVGYRLEVG